MDESEDEEAEGDADSARAKRRPVISSDSDSEWDNSKSEWDKLLSCGTLFYIRHWNSDKI